MQSVLIGDLLAIPQGPYLTLLAGPTRSGLRNIIRTRQLSLVPRLSGLVSPVKSLGQLARVILSNKQSQIGHFQINTYEFVT